MTETAVKQYLEHLSVQAETKKELFEEAKKISLQFCLHKIPNLENDKRIQCKLPNSLNTGNNELQICLIVKDVDAKDRDYERTIRKYKQILENEGLSDVISRVMPIKQLKLEFRHYEAKRNLCTSFDLFLSDKCLHEILFSGSKLGKEFKKRKRMPVEIDMEGNVKEQINDILHSTNVTLTGKGPIFDVNTCLSTHSVKQACENINAVKSIVLKNVPGGEENIKSIYLKSTDQIAVPLYVSDVKAFKEVKLQNNMTDVKVKKAKKLSGKRLKRKKIQEAKEKKRKERQLLAAEADKENSNGVSKPEVKSAEPTKTVVKKEKKPVDTNVVPKVDKKAIKKPTKAKLPKKSAFIK